MRVLLVSALSPERSDVAAVATALGAAGHEVRRLDGTPGPAAEAGLAASIAKSALLFRPKVALLEASPYLSGSAAALKAARIPYVLWVPDAGIPAAGGATELFDAALGLACAHAAAVIVGSDAAADVIAERAGLSEMELLEAGLDLDDLPLGDRGEARAALGLPPDRPVLGLIGALVPETGLDTLALAHRQLAGYTLLLAGDGPEERAVFAMTAATRPSSPVLHVGPLTAATRVITGCAADIVLALDRRALTAESWSAAALGRRQITYDVPGTDVVAALYPEHRTVFASPEIPEALREVIEAAVREESEAGPLPAAAVNAARAQLDAGTRWARLAERVVQCA